MLRFVSFQMLHLVDDEFFNMFHQHEPQVFQQLETIGFQTLFHPYFLFGRQFALDFRRTQFDLVYRQSLRFQFVAHHFDTTVADHVFDG